MSGTLGTGRLLEALRSAVPNKAHPYWHYATRSKIITYLQDGANLENAVRMVSVPSAMFKTWENKGKIELKEYVKFYGTEDEVEMGEYAQFLLDIDVARTVASHRFRVMVQALYLEDARYGSIFMRLMEAEHPEVYGRKQQVETKTEQKISYTFRTVNGDSFNKPRLAKGEIEEEEENSEDIIDATYLDREL